MGYDCGPFLPEFRLYPWQAECLNCGGGAVIAPDLPRNLVYSTPTSGGKTLVAQTLVLRRLISTGRPCMLVFPFKSLCDEMANRLEPILEALGRKTLRHYGSNVNRNVMDRRTGVLVCVIEKANLIVNKLMENEFTRPREPGDDTLDLEYPRLSDLSCVVVDELHSVGDGERGALLEETLSKVLYAQGKWRAHVGTPAKAAHPNGPHASDSGLKPTPMPSSGHTGTPSQFKPPWIQVVGMSATITNFDEVAQWMDAVLYVSTYRPVRLRQFIRLPGRRVGQTAAPCLVELREDATPTSVEIALSEQCVAGVTDLPTDKADEDNIFYLVKQTLDEGGSLLVFCPTKVRAWLSGVIGYL